MRSTLFLKIEFAYLPGIAQSRPRPHPQPRPGHSRGRNHSHKSRFHSYKAPIPLLNGLSPFQGADFGVSGGLSPFQGAAYP